MPTLEEILAAVTKLTETVGAQGDIQKKQGEAISAVTEQVANLSVAPIDPLNPDEGPNPNIEELLQSPDGVKELGERAEAEAKQIVDAEAQKLHVVEFAARIAGGTIEKPFGLPVPAAEIVALLLSLPKPQAAKVEQMLEKAHVGAIDFVERGYDGMGVGYKPQVPAKYKKLMASWLKTEGNTVESFFEANPEIGTAEQFNLSEFGLVKEVA